MKLLNYNIREGLLANYSDYRANHDLKPIVDDARYQLLVDFLVDQSADVVQLQELAGWDQPSFDRFRDKADYSFGAFFPASTRFHLGVLSRQPIAEAMNLNQLTDGVSPSSDWWHQRHYWHGLPKTVIDDITYFTVHLCPRTPDQRLHELANLLKELPETRTVISGDFNAPRSAEYAGALFSQLSDQQHDKFGPAGTKNVVDELTAHGFIDVFSDEPKEFTAPTKSNTDLGHGVTPLRLDFCLVSRDLKDSVGQHQVIRTEQTDAISDHYPLIVELRTDV